MRHKIKAKAIEIAKNPHTQKVILSMKPQKNIWGISGVVFFFIVPEIIAYIWGVDITQYAKNELLTANDFLEQKYYEFLVMLFEDGMSWFNLAFGVALLFWLFF